MTENQKHTETSEFLASTTEKEEAPQAAVVALKKAFNWIEK